MSTQVEFRRQLATIRRILDGSIPINPDQHRVLADRYAAATRRINRRLHGYYDNIELPPVVTLLSAAEYDFWVELCLEYHWSCPEHINARILAGYLATGDVPTETAPTRRIALPLPERPAWLAPVRVPPAPKVTITPKTPEKRPPVREKHTAQRRKRRVEETPPVLLQPMRMPNRNGWISWVLLFVTLLILFLAFRYVTGLSHSSEAPVETRSTP